MHIYIFMLYGMCKETISIWGKQYTEARAAV